jgi:hypothetical protein
MTTDAPGDGMSEVELPRDIYEFLEARAQVSGRTIADQFIYEFKLNRGLICADPHDEEGRQRGQVMRKILSRQVRYG